MENLKVSSDALFILLGAILVLAMHAGFPFRELGTVRKKNQVNALVKILADFSVSTVAYFFIGYTLAYPGLARKILWRTVSRFCGLHRRACRGWLDRPGRGSDDWWRSVPDRTS